MFNPKPTVNEANYYLKPIVDELLNEYKKITHPDFDKALKKRIGIGWKQIKNYKSHSDPTSVIPKNSKIIKFILKSRSQDKLYKTKRTLVFTGAFVFVVTAGFLIKDNIQTERAIYEVKLNTLIKKRLNQLLSIKGLSGCSKKSELEIICGKNIYIKN